MDILAPSPPLLCKHMVPQLTHGVVPRRSEEEVEEDGVKGGVETCDRWQPSQQCIGKPWKVEQGEMSPMANPWSPHLWGAPGSLGMASLTLGQVHDAHTEARNNVPQEPVLDGVAGHPAQEGQEAEQQGLGSRARASGREGAGAEVEHKCRGLGDISEGGCGRMGSNGTLRTLSSILWSLVSPQAGGQSGDMGTWAGK